MVREKGKRVANIPNAGFVSYLGSYGKGDELQIDEHVAQIAEKYGIKSLEFELPRQQSYREAIARVIAHHHSTLILLSGRAGDGKTHFLRTLFTDSKYIGGTRTLWNQSPNCFEFHKQTEHGLITFTLVKDFTLSNSEADQRKLRTTIARIFAQNQASAQEQAHSQDQPEITPAQLETLPHDPCHIVIIAGNNGKILERFQSFYGAGQDTKEVTTFIHALERYMLEHDRSDIDKLPGVQCHDMSACLGAAEIAAIYTEVLGDMRWNRCQECDYHNLCPIARNRAVLQAPLVLTRLLQCHELLIDNGMHFTMRNVLLLIVNALFGRTNDDKYLNCRTVQRNYNAVHKQIEALPPTLTDEAARQAAIDHIVMKSPLGSKPFDNFLGLNLKEAANGKRGRKKSEDPQQVSFLSDDTKPIFHELGTLSLGHFSTKLSDEFLVLGANTEVFAEPIAQFHQKLSQDHDHYNLFASLQRSYQQVQDQDFNEDSAEQAEGAPALMQELLMSLRRLMFFVLPDPVSDQLFTPILEQARVAVIQKQGSIAATASQATTKAPALNGKPFFAPFLLTSYPFGLSYLKLKHDALAIRRQALERGARGDLGINLKNSQSYDIACQLIVGLNRAFTNLMIVAGADDKVYITTNNKIDPMALSVIYDSARYQIKVEYEGQESNNVIRFEEHGTERLALVFCSKALYGLDQAELKGKKRYLDLNPKLFEYLMALAMGTSGLSFSQENTNDLSAFKASIDATIAEQISFTYLHIEPEPSFEVLFNNIQICQLNEAGGLD